ncbi:MAG: hypothetical protein ACLFOY_00030 [Desulfatibacillaceae bacterium]
MRFSALLFGLYNLLRVASVVNRPFKKHIKNTRLRLLIRTRDRSRGRLFIFDKGRIRTRAGANHEFDVALVFKDTATGFAVLSDRRKDAVFNAAARGDVHLEGMSAWAMWFEQTMALIM